MTVADPADRDGRDSLARDHDIYTAPAKKDVEAGIDAVAERLAVSGQGHPASSSMRTVTSCCANSTCTDADRTARSTNKTTI